MRVSFVLPTYNESLSIEKAIQRIESLALNIDKEIIVVDDDSPDGTSKIVKSLSYQFNDLRLVRRYGRSGLASAIKEGIMCSTGSAVVVMDADGQHDIGSISSMLSLLENDPDLDLVIGSRFKADPNDLKGLSKSRTLGSTIANKTSRFVLDRRYQRLTDFMSGFFAFKASSLEEISKAVDVEGFKFLFEALSLSKGKLNVKEVAIRFHEREAGSSKLDIPVVWDYVISLIHSGSFRLMPRRMIGFGLVGLSGVVIQLSASSLLDLFTPGSFSQTLPFAVTLAAVWNFTLNNQLTFRSRKLKGKNYISGLLKFLFVSSLPIAANVGAAAYIYNTYGGSKLSAQLAGIVIAYLWNYVASSKVVWNSN